VALSSVDLKHVGDLSEAAVNCGWRMKFSSSRNNKPYFYRLKHESDVLWSRSEVSAVVSREGGFLVPVTHRHVANPIPPRAPQMEKRVKDWVKERKERKLAAAQGAVAEAPGGGEPGGSRDAGGGQEGHAPLVAAAAGGQEEYDPFAEMTAFVGFGGPDEMNTSD
jgi:hypothetical protein